MNIFLYILISGNYYTMDLKSLILESFMEVLLEMPHIRFVMDGREELYDLRVEGYINDWEGLVLATREYLNSFGVREEKARKYFFRELSRYPNIDLFFSKFYKKTLEDFEKVV